MSDKATTYMPLPIEDWMRRAAAEQMKVLLSMNMDEITLRGVFVAKIAEAYRAAESQRTRAQAAQGRKEVDVSP